MHECPEESEITSKYVQLLLEHVIKTVRDLHRYLLLLL